MSTGLLVINLEAVKFAFLQMDDTGIQQFIAKNGYAFWVEEESGDISSKKAACHMGVINVDTLKKYIKNELTGWKPFDIIWFVIATGIILGLSIYWKDTWMSLLAAITGVWCVILTGKGKRSSFIFGLINVIFYAIVAFEAKYYGEVMLNALYYLPMNFVGWFVWKKHMNDHTGEVVKERLTPKKSVIVYALTAVAIFIYGLFLKALGGNLPFIDSMSTVISVVAQILSIKRLMEQWILWIVVDVVTVIMWAVHFAQGSESIATLAMWSVYLVNAFIMFFRWYKESKKNEV